MCKHGHMSHCKPVGVGGQLVGSFLSLGLWGRTSGPEAWQQGLLSVRWRGSEGLALTSALHRCPLPTVPLVIGIRTVSCGSGRWWFPATAVLHISAFLRLSPYDLAFFLLFWDGRTGLVGETTDQRIVGSNFPEVPRPLKFYICCVILLTTH